MDGWADRRIDRWIGSCGKVSGGGELLAPSPAVTPSTCKEQSLPQK